MTIKNKNDGHLSTGMCQAAIDDATEIMAKIGSIEDCCLPTWWTSKLAVASAYLNSLRDYVTYNMDDILEESESGEEGPEHEASETPEEELVEDAVEGETEQTEEHVDLADEMLPPSARMMKNATKAG